MLIRLLILCLITISTSVIAMEEIAITENINFCLDTQAAIDNDVLAVKNSEDTKLIKLVALRSGLCELLGKEIITLEFAIDLFNEQQAATIRKQFEDRAIDEASEPEFLDI